MEAAASFCPLLTPNIPARTFSAMKVAVYIDKANAREINSGIILTPPLYTKTVVDSCSNSGISNVKVTPANKKVKRGNRTGFFCKNFN